MWPNLEAPDVHINPYHLLFLRNLEEESSWARNSAPALLLLHKALVWSTLILSVASCVGAPRGDLWLHFHLTEAALESLAMVMPWGQVPIQASFQTQKVLGSFRCSRPSCEWFRTRKGSKAVTVPPLDRALLNMWNQCFFLMIVFPTITPGGSSANGNSFESGWEALPFAHCLWRQMSNAVWSGISGSFSSCCFPSSPSGFCLRWLPCFQLLQHHQRTFSATAFISQLLPNTIVKLLRDHNKFCSNRSETSGSGPRTWDVSAAH